ncbi:hypothetical protein JCM13664_14430 [Methylothermus subterraneus]
MKIAVLGSGNRLAETVRAFIRRSQREWMLVEVGHAEVGIIDLDAYGAEKFLTDWRQRHPEQPVIAMALQEPKDKSLVWLKKPFTAEDLTRALESVCAPKTRLVVRQETGGSVHGAAAGVAAKNRGEVLHVRSNWAEEASQYNPADYLQGWLAKAYRQAALTGIVVRLETGWEPILIFPKHKRVWTGGDDKKLHAFCRVPLKTFARLNGRAAEVLVEIRPEPLTANLPEPLQPMDAFLWKVAWWSSGGRLPFGLASDQAVRLKHWPNLTRYWCPPYAVRLAALLVQNPVAPCKAAELLGLAFGEVFGFLSAASALGLLEQVSTPARPRLEEPQTSAKNPGLLRRILQRLLKG